MADMSNTSANEITLDEGMVLYKETTGAVLLDVRSPDEFKQGHVPEAQNLEVYEIAKIIQMVPDKETPIFCYCKSGARSAHAAMRLEMLGYKNVKHIGGVDGYSGVLTRR